MEETAQWFKEATDVLKGILSRSALRGDDIYATSLIQPLLLNEPFLPFTNASMRPFSLACILNDVVVNERTSIIEFGPGISTILVGRLIRKNNLNAKIVSVENKESWLKTMQTLIRNEGLQDIISILHAPLKPCSFSLSGNDWYDTDVLNKHDFVSNLTFDLVLIDGPNAWDPPKKLARYPAFPFIIDKLKDNFSVYLDDANRDGEQEIIKKWETQYNVTFRIIGETLGHLSKGPVHNTMLK